MDSWLHKMRRIWHSVSSRLNPSRKPGGTGGCGSRDDASGLLKLRDDVEMCPYDDVHVMWNMLNSKSSQEQGRDRATAAAPPPSSNTRNNSKCGKQRLTWRFFLWSDHRRTSSSFP